MSRQAWPVFAARQVLRSVEQRPRLAAALSNAAWISGDNLLRTGVRVLLGVWVARYLGPEQFGLLSYSIALVSLFAMFAGLELGIVVVRDLVEDPKAAAEILGTACLLQFLGSCVAFGLLIIVIYFVRPNEPVVIAMVVILGSTMFIRPTNVIKYWFDSLVAYKYVVWAENAGFLLTSLLKLILIFAGAPVIAFAWASFAEAALIAFALVLNYRWKKGTRWRIAFTRGIDLVRASWPLLIAGLSFIVYSRIDQIMLGQMRSDAEVGIYSAAIRVSEIWLFLPGAIVGSVFPSIVAARTGADGAYERRLQLLFDALAAIGIAFAVGLTFLANPVIALAFGAKFQEAGTVLAIYAWAGVFVGLDAAGARYMLLEGLQRIVMWRHLLGAGLNILVNWLVIPRYGMNGAAMASTLSFVTANYLLDLVDRRTRALFVQKSRALLFLWAFRQAPGKRTTGVRAHPN